MSTMQTSKPMTECPKCGGAGRISHFAHIESGACFRCGGTGTVVLRAKRAAKVVVAVVQAPTVAQLERELESARRLIANSHRGEVAEYDTFSMNLIRLIADELTRASTEDRATYEPKFREVLGCNWHLVKIAA